MRLDLKPADPARTNYFAIYFIESGSGTFWADTSCFEFGPESLLFFVPYQYVRFVPDHPVHGQVIQFHANFLCVETFHAEVGCSGVLFNDPQGILVVTLDEQAKSDVTNLIERIRKEQSQSDQSAWGMRPKRIFAEKGKCNRLTLNKKGDSTEAPVVAASEESLTPAAGKGRSPGSTLSAYVGPFIAQRPRHQIIVHVSPPQKVCMGLRAETSEQQLSCDLLSE